MNGSQDDFDEDDIEEVIDLDGEDEHMYDEDDDDDLPQINDDAELVFCKHDDSVFCCNINKSGNYIVTGGQDDKGYVWDVKTGNIVLECIGHSDSVICAEFNFDSSYVATADMLGVIKVWKMDTKLEILSFETNDLCWMRWHGEANVLLAGTNDGFMWMWKIPSGDCRTFCGPGKSCEVGKLLPDGKKVACGYQDGSVKIWDLKSGEFLHSLSGVHKDSITCIDCDIHSKLATGSVDGTVKLINANDGKLFTSFSCADDSELSVESVAFCPSQSLLASGTTEGHLGLWDLTRQALRLSCKQEAGISKIIWHSTDPILYTSGLDGVAREWDARSGNVTRNWTGHKADILDFDISLDAGFIVTASDDHTSRIFSLKSTENT